MRALRFYATAAPEWWRWQLVSLQTGPQMPRRKGFYRVMLDNGLFIYYRRGVKPELDTWLRRIAVAANTIARAYEPAELAVILPDWPSDPGFAVRAAEHPLARSLCRDYPCYGVAHPQKGLDGFARTAEELAARDTVAGLAVPLKLHCSYYSEKADRHVPDEECQLNAVLQVARVARTANLKMPVHGLAPLLRPRHVARLARAGVGSIDTTSWTRPNTAQLARLLGRRSVAGQYERELAFAYLVARMVREGVPIEDAETAISVYNRLTAGLGVAPSAASTA